ncbi:hypothetical protein E2I20_21370 [Alcaligenaceae bacterium SAGV3]|nr:hypothetical protein [Alcaligenaceae bacterium SAGV3]
MRRPAAGAQAVRAQRSRSRRCRDFPVAGQPAGRAQNSRGDSPPDCPYCPARPAIVAIGGITPANAKQAATAGADALAVITALFGADDIEAAARAFGQAWAEDSAGAPTKA